MGTSAERTLMTGVFLGNRNREELGGKFAERNVRGGKVAVGVLVHSVASSLPYVAAS